MGAIVSDVKRIIQLVQEGKVVVPWSRVLIHLKEKPETFGNSGIVRHEAYTPQDLIGNIVGYGWSVDDRFKKEHPLGQTVLVSYDGVAASRNNFTLGDEKVQLTLVSEKDVWLGFPEEL